VFEQISIDSPKVMFALSEQQMEQLWTTVYENICEYPGNQLPTISRKKPEIPLEKMNEVDIEFSLSIRELSFDILQGTSFIYRSFLDLNHYSKGTVVSLPLITLSGQSLDITVLFYFSTTLKVWTIE